MLAKVHLTEDAAGIDKLKGLDNSEFVAKFSLSLFC